MRKFHFPLERVLRLREFRESEWEHKLGEITSKCLAIENQIRSMAGEYTRNYRHFKEGETVRPEIMLSRDMYAERIRVTVTKLEEELLLKELERSEIQEKFLEASKEKKVLEKLRERQESAYNRNALKEEAKTIDELGLNLYRRARTGRE